MASNSNPSSISSQSRRDSLASISPSTSGTFPNHDLDWPFGCLDSSLDRHDLRQSAYELFFAASRSSSRNHHPPDPAAPPAAHPAAPPPPASPKPLIQPSKLKKSLGLKPARRPRSASGGGGGRPRRPLTAAELMRQQMRVSEQCDSRLRKALMRTGLGQMGRRAETTVLPLELLRYLKPSDFNDSYEYHIWQKRQLKTLEAGLVLHPAVPLNPSNAAALRLRDLVRSADLKAIEASKNSDTILSLSNSVAALAWRGSGDAPSETCHWADGVPLNLNLYLALLQSVFDVRDETLVVDEVDELIEMMKKTWPALGINKAVHNVCFTWALFQQFVVTGQIEQDLLCAAIAMLGEVADDAKNAGKESVQFKILIASTLSSMQGWAEKRLVDYHESFHKATVGAMENVLPLALSAVEILHVGGGAVNDAHEEGGLLLDSRGSRVDYYIRSSMRNAFAKMLEAHNATCHGSEGEEEGNEEDAMSEPLIQMVKETEELAGKEKEMFTPFLKRWHPIPAGVAAVTLHNCYGLLLKQYLGDVTILTNEAVHALQAAAKLEKDLVQLVEEDSADCEDGGKTIMTEMVPFEVDSIVHNLKKSWIEERLSKIKDSINRAKDTETWNPKSKSEPYAQSAVELMKMAKDTVDDFFQIPAVVSEDMVQHLAAGLENLAQEYVTFVASCGSKQNYIPPLPPLTRCNQDPRIRKLWMKARPCRSPSDQKECCSGDVHNPRPSTSRGTQRLYIRLNTLHYLHGLLHSVDKTLSLSSRSQPPAHKPRRRFSTAAPSYFDLARASIQTATHHVAEVAAYRLIFLDSNCVFYDSLYEGEVANARIRPALRTLKQNLTLLAAILTDRAQPMALRGLMKASFEAFLMVLLAGGPTRTYLRSDYDMVSEDFSSLKRMFCTIGEGLVAEEVVEREAEVVEGVVALMGQATEQLVEDFSIVACEASGLGIAGTGQKVPMPPTTGRWNRTDPNTILRVLCHRTDEAANRFLKRTFQLAKRR